MAKKPEFDWFAADWLAGLGITQADLQRSLGWSKAKASDVITGKQRYNRDIVNQLALLLSITPYELLMHPSEAAAFKGLKASATGIVRMVEREADETKAAETKTAARRKAG